MREPRRFQFRGANTPLIVAGYVLAVLLPVLGLILGILVLSNGPRNHAVGIIALSIVVAAASYIWLF